MVFPGRLDRTSKLALAATVLSATIVSLAATGFQFGISNNAFHIPFVLRYSELPVFQGDAFYDSLRNFTSLVWPALRLISTEQNAGQVFLVGHFLSRTAAFLSLFWFFRVNGAVTTPAIFVSLMMVAICPWMLDYTAVGRHGLFVGIFTHSEVTWGPLIAALVAAQLGRLPLAAILAGVVFSINAFIGIWLVAILAATVAGNPVQRRDWKLLVTSSIGFLLVSAPVVIWIAVAISGSGDVPEFSYIEYVRGFFPAHFLIESASPRALRDLAIISYCGVLAAYLSANRGFWVTVVSACIGLLIIGAVLPYILNHRFVFNLHLLRVDGVLRFLFVILVSSVSIATLGDSSNSGPMRVVATLAASSLITLRTEPSYLVVCAACLSLMAIMKVRGLERGMAATHPGVSSKAAGCLAGALVLAALTNEFLRIGVAPDSVARWALTLGVMLAVVGANRAPQFPGYARAAVLGTVAAVTAATAVSWRSISVEEVYRESSQFDQMTLWVRQSPLAGPFLFPIGSRYRRAFNRFQLRARRPVWVDYMQGAAVMWDPSFYWQWKPRVDEVSALRTRSDFLRYAVEQGIPYVVLPARLGDCPSGANTVFENSGYAICASGSE